MKYTYRLIIILLLLTCQFCSGAEHSNSEKIKEDCHTKKEPKTLTSVNDLVLIYSGGAHRTATWDTNHFTPYVSYKDIAEKEHWLFDGFLFLEIVDGKGKIFATGYNGMPSTQKEWEELIQHYFTFGNDIYALEDCVAKTTQRIGKFTKKRKVIIGIPEPIVPMKNNNYNLPSTYWGKVNGKQLDFSINADRVTACKWYIDYAIQCFDEAKFENIELAGFYWIAEETLHTKTILAEIASYLNEKMYSFNWIPYWKTTPDYYDWQSLKFNYAYLQPNYFFNNTIPYSRLNEACEVAKKYNLDVELEFDMRVMAEKENWAHRLYDYMNAFRENGILETKRIAYYQDADALYALSHSENTANRQLYHDFCSFVLEHIEKMK